MSQLNPVSLSDASRVLSFLPHALDASCDEMLYGTSGYLWTLLFLQKHIGNFWQNLDNPQPNPIPTLIEAILSSGKL
jgi:hypothetical protein